MAKFGFGGGGQPMPAAAAPAGATAAAMPQRTGGGMFGGLSDESRNQMVQGFLQAAMSSAGQGGSPLMAGLAPILGAVIGGRSQAKADTIAKDRNAAMADSILGDLAKNPQAKSYMDVINDPSAPDGLRSIAKSRLDKLINPPKASKGRGGGSRASGGNSGNLYGEYNLGGNLAGRNKQGEIVLYRDGDGNPVPFTSTRGLGVDRGDGTGGAASPPAIDTTAPAPMVNVDPNDPLGILNLPPA